MIQLPSILVTVDVYVKNIKMLYKLGRVCSWALAPKIFFP